MNSSEERTEIIYWILSLGSVAFLIADYKLDAEELFISLSVLPYLGVDQNSLAEQKGDLLDEIDCSVVRSRPAGTRGGKVSRRLPARHNRVSNTDYDLPTSTTNLLETIDSGQYQDISEAVENNIHDERENGLPVDKLPDLDGSVKVNLAIFQTSLSSGPAADLQPLKINIQGNAGLMCFCQRNYTQVQRSVLSKPVDMLVNCGMEYANPTSPLASAAPLIPRLDPDGFKFIDDRRLVNKYTKISVPYVEHRAGINEHVKVQILCRISPLPYFLKISLTSRVAYVSVLHSLGQFLLSDSSPTRHDE